MNSRRLRAAAAGPARELDARIALSALERARLLDSPPEEPFDRLAHLVGQLLDVPVVLMSIVDRQRQFFKAQVGLPEPLCAIRQTPLTHSFCQWVVTGDEALVVEDARRDLLFSANPATIEMGIVAYAGVPIRVEPDETIGSFCAVDMKPRRWDTRELPVLYDIATVVQGLTALRQVAWLLLLTSSEFRGLAGVTGRALEAAMRLYEAGKTRVEAAEQQALLGIASGLLATSRARRNAQLPVDWVPERLLMKAMLCALALTVLAWPATDRDACRRTERRRLHDARARLERAARNPRAPARRSAQAHPADDAAPPGRDVDRGERGVSPRPARRSIRAAPSLRR